MGFPIHEKILISIPDSSAGLVAGRRSCFHLRGLIGFPATLTSRWASLRSSAAVLKG